MEEFTKFNQFKTFFIDHLISAGFDTRVEDDLDRNRHVIVVSNADSAQIFSVTKNETLYENKNLELFAKQICDDFLEKMFSKKDVCDWVTLV